MVGTAGEPGSYPDIAGANPDAAMLSARLDRLGPDGSADRELPRGIRAAVIVTSIVLVAVPVASYAVILGIVP